MLPSHNMSHVKNLLFPHLSQMHARNQNYFIPYFQVKIFNVLVLQVSLLFGAL